jgi:hypothetical protein
MHDAAKANPAAAARADHQAAFGGRLTIRRTTPPASLSPSSDDERPAWGQKRL